MKRSQLIFAVILGAFLASTLVIACGGGGGGLAVALLIDTNYVDYLNPPDDEGYEAYNLQYHLETEGIDHDLISGGNLHRLFGGIGRERHTYHPGDGKRGCGKRYYACRSWCYQ